MQAVGAVEEFLLAVEEVEENDGGSLGEDGEVDAANAVAEDEVAEEGSEEGGEQDDGEGGEGEEAEGGPEPGQFLDAVEPHEVGELTGGNLQLQVHGEGVATDSKEDAVTEAEQAGVAPDQVDTEGDNGQGEVAPELVEAEVGEDEGHEDGEDQNQGCDRANFNRNLSPLLLFFAGRSQGCFCCHGLFLTINGTAFLGKQSCGPNLQEGNNQGEHHDLGHTALGKEVEELIQLLQG